MTRFQSVALRMRAKLFPTNRITENEHSFINTHINSIGGIEEFKLLLANCGQFREELNDEIKVDQEPTKSSAPMHIDRKFLRNAVKYTHTHIRFRIMLQRGPTITKSESRYLDTYTFTAI